MAKEGHPVTPIEPQVRCKLFSATRNLPRPFQGDERQFLGKVPTGRMLTRNRYVAVWGYICARNGAPVAADRTAGME